MAYSVNWEAKEITIPQSDLTLLATAEYRLPLADFHKEIRRLEWEFTEGFAYPQVMLYNIPVTFSGITLVPVIQIINGYTVIFENGAYSVELDGANSNIVDVTQYNQVRPIPKNTAGYTLVETGVSGLTQAESDALINIENDVATIDSNIATMQTDIGTMQTDISDIDANIASIDVNIATINVNIATMQTDIASIESQMANEFARALGLMQENYYLDQTSYVDVQGQKLMTAARMRIYSDPASVGGTSDVIATYDVTANWVGQELSNYKVVKQ